MHGRMKYLAQNACFSNPILPAECDFSTNYTIIMISHPALTHEALAKLARNLGEESTNAGRFEKTNGAREFVILS